MGQQGKRLVVDFGGALDWRLRSAALGLLIRHWTKT